MRTFIAIELPQEIKDSLSTAQSQLKKSGADIRWVKPENIHLTLKFLGEIDEGKKDKIVSLLEDIAANTPAFTASVSSLGAFPKISSPRIIWVGIDKGERETKSIAKVLEEEIAKVGIPKEDRPFSSHITIGRTKSAFEREKLIQELKNLEGDFGRQPMEFRVKKITLFKSTLTPGGPIYEALYAASLKAA